MAVKIALYRVDASSFILTCSECGRKTYYGAEFTHTSACPTRNQRTMAIKLDF
jgi:hypothetical protein